MKKLELNQRMGVGLEHHCDSHVNYTFICHQSTDTKNQSALASAEQISKFFIVLLLLKLAFRMTPQKLFIDKFIYVLFRLNLISSLLHFFF